MVRMRSIIRVFLLAALIMFLTGAYIFADTLNTVVTKETSGIYRIRQFVVGSGPGGPPVDNPGDRPEPDGIWTWLNATKQGEYYPAAPGAAHTIDLTSGGGTHAKKDKTLIQLSGGGVAAGAFTYSNGIKEGLEIRTKAYGANMSMTTPPVISSDPTTSTEDGITYIESFTVSNMIGGVDVYGIINVTVIEYN